jgi:hypothetical protein
MKMRISKLREAESATIVFVSLVLFVAAALTDCQTAVQANEKKGERTPPLANPRFEAPPQQSVRATRTQELGMTIEGRVPLTQQADGSPSGVTDGGPL